jgi:branched-chain amino acid transport system ATP-binding protein
MSKLLEIKSLKSWYGESQALFDINLQIEKGEIVALLGRNGWVSLLQLTQFVAWYINTRGILILTMFH